MFTGRLLTPKEGVSTGDITYNGDTMDSRRFEITSVISFAEQSDTHEPFLTVRETLLFAGICNMPIVNCEVCMEDQIRRIWNGALFFILVLLLQLLNTAYGKALIKALGTDEQLKHSLEHGKHLDCMKVRSLSGRMVLPMSCGTSYGEVGAYINQSVAHR